MFFCFFTGLSKKEKTSGFMTKLTFITSISGNVNWLERVLSDWNELNLVYGYFILDVEVGLVHSDVFYLVDKVAHDIAPKGMSLIRYDTLQEICL